MSSQPSTVEVDGYSITSHEDPDAMLEALKPEKADAGEARITVREGQAVPIPEPKDKLSEAASALGKKGGEAAAAKRASEAKEKPKEEPADLAAEQKAGEVDEAAEAKRKVDEEIAKADPAQKKQVASDRVQEATRAAAEAKRAAAAERRERERLQAEVERLRAVSGTPAEAKPRPQPAQADPEPKVEEFEDYGEYVAKRARWEARQEFREQQRNAFLQAKAHAYAENTRTRLTAYQERLRAAREADPTFQSRIHPQVRSLYASVELQPGETLMPGNIIADCIVDSEVAPALLLHLSENPDEFQRLVALPNPPAIIRAMGKLEARLEGATHGTSPPDEEISQAKPPLRPVSGSPHTAADIEPNEDDDYDTYVRKMDAKEKRSSKR